MRERVVGGAYRVGELLGRGAMGDVYAAIGPRGEEVALKFMRPDIADLPELSARFRREAKIAARIVSPFVARVLGAGKERGGALWIAFERLRGESLDLRLQLRKRLPVSDVRWIVAHVLQGLGAAHAVGVVHRDVKPGNVFLESARPRARLIDFGVSKLRDPSVETGAPNLTATADALGSPRFMAPEQMASALNVDARADLYSVGVVAFLSLTGAFPFEGATLAGILHAKRTAPAKSLADVTRRAWPVPIERFLARLLTLDPAGRWSDATLALAEWQRACDAAGGFGGHPSGEPEPEPEDDPSTTL